MNAEALQVAADTILRRAVEPDDGRAGVPGVVAMATDRHANVYAGAAGVRTLGDSQPMTADTVVCLWSTTKAITGAAVMQLVDDGKLSLDDAAEEYVPELRDLKVLEGFEAGGEPRVRAPKSAPTVGQLLLHTAGFGYDIFNADLVAYGKRRKIPSVGTSTRASLPLVLLFDPGERWEYGTGIDWAGKVVESISGMRLGDAMRERIFEPLGMHDTGFTLPPDLRARRAATHHRAPDGSLTAAPNFELPQQPEQHMGGHGLYATVGDYMQFIRMILNDGAAAGGARILAPRTVAAMAANGLGTRKITKLPGAIARLSNDAEFFPGLDKSWGLTWMINDADAPTGRPAGALAWAGLANLYYWIDRKNGIGGFWATQILPFIDAISLDGYLRFETAVYENLR